MKTSLDQDIDDLRIILNNVFDIHHTMVSVNPETQPLWYIYCKLKARKGKERLNRLVGSVTL